MNVATMTTAELTRELDMGPARELAARNEIRRRQYAVLKARAIKPVQSPKRPECHRCGYIGHGATSCWLRAS